MREDLPWEAPLPELWSLSLAPGGVIVDQGPYLEDFAVVGSIEPGEAHCWRVRDGADGDDEPNTRVLCETKFVLPERFAVPQLGRLRELMLREARLLDKLSHDCVVPLEHSWLEQRIGLERPRVCVYDGRGSGPLRDSRRPCPENVMNDRPASADECASAEGCLRSSGSSRRRDRGGLPSDETEALSQRPHLVGESATAVEDANESLFCYSGYGQMGSSDAFAMEGGDGSRREDDAVAFLLRSWVPLMVTDIEVDDDGEYCGAGDGQDGAGEVVRCTKIGKGLSCRGSQGVDVEQLRWGGDHTTSWRGAAEPKSKGCWANSTEETLIEKKPSDGNEPGALGFGEGYFRSCDYRERVKAEKVGEKGAYFLWGERTLCLASYLLLPDWLPLSVWFETEFEPRTAISGEQDGAVTMGLVTTPDDWALIWRHLLSMFVQVVRGVEHLHGHGLVHNNISPSSVWVASDGRCCVGNLGNAAPPGNRRQPSRAEGCGARNRHFASPERLQGYRVGAKSDMYSLGGLILEFWRHFMISRGLGDLRLMYGAAVQAPKEDERLLLDADLVTSMLAKEPFDRPDCFEVVESLGELVRAC